MRAPGRPSCQKDPSSPREGKHPTPASSQGAVIFGGCCDCSCARSHLTCTPYMHPSRSPAPLTITSYSHHPVTVFSRVWNPMLERHTGIFGSRTRHAVGRWKTCGNKETNSTQNPHIYHQFLYSRVAQSSVPFFHPPSPLREIEPLSTALILALFPEPSVQRRKKEPEEPTLLASNWAKKPWPSLKGEMCPEVSCSTGDCPVKPFLGASLLRESHRRDRRKTGGFRFNRVSSTFQ